MRTSVHLVIAISLMLCASPAGFMTVTRSFEPEIASVRHVRAFVGDAMGIAPQSATAVLLASELAANAVEHGGGQIAVSVQTHPDGAAWVGVTDQSAQCPRVVSTPADAPRGRGMQIVDALSHGWGVEPTSNGKPVWFTLPAQF
jgi:two-component sensor histidine kinase